MNCPMPDFGGQVLCACELGDSGFRAISPDMRDALEEVVKSGDGVFRSDRYPRYTTSACSESTLTMREVWPFIKIDDKCAINQEYPLAEYELVIIVYGPKDDDSHPPFEKTLFAIVRRKIKMIEVPRFCGG